MILKEEKLISELIKRGIDRGYVESYKISDIPTTSQIKNCIFDSIISEIKMYFDFDVAIREKYPANIEGSIEFNEANAKQRNHIPSIDRRVGGC